jgi:hypothetical protein
MAVSGRSFIFLNEKWVKIGNQRLFDFYCSRTALPKYANQTLYVACIMMETEHNQPTHITRAEYSIYRVDSDGMKNQDDNRAQGELVNLKLTERRVSNNNTVHAGNDFIERRLSHRLTWQPTGAQVDELHSILFKPKKVAKKKPSHLRVF